MNDNNQNFFQKNAGALVLAVLAGVGLWIYTAFFKIIPQSSAQPITAVGQEVITTLRRLENVSLDGSLFSTSEFQRLAEFELVIPSQPVGRPNPFASFR
ncbi:MAG: hypothetical protein U1D31_02185 [Patescibacteria group bacterium]|nr:hypothetical protein [bacterium]MDZ4240911.1 hypothetical protein [Patescibacteria group bacterium]